MKLIKCHIDNFGILSDFDFEFNDGLNTIYKSNGSGKSTFAAFIKAMIYGFPRTSRRNIIDNERKRYDPWQGGKYGGYLDFEEDGIRYRVTRYFGKAAAKDEFSLIDLTSNKYSYKYSEKLGEELFNIDADSFSRSVYVSQLSSDDVQATASIRVKLSNLVDDTNDLNNYDTAIKKLKDYRIKLCTYRGNGGLINELKDQYNNLENERYQTEQKKPYLYSLIRTIEQLDKDRSTELENIESLNAKIAEASDKKVEMASKQHLLEMKADVAKIEQYLSKMDECYKAGYPSLEDVKEQRENINIIKSESNHIKVLKFNSFDKDVINEGQKWFSDCDKVKDDIDKCEKYCRELEKVSAETLTPEEHERIGILGKQFSYSVPTDEELQKYTDIADKLYDAQCKYGSIDISEKFNGLFQHGIPSEKELEDCENAQDEYNRLVIDKEKLHLSENEQKQYNELSLKFESGVPSENEVKSKQSDSRRVQELITKQNIQTTVAKNKQTQNIIYRCAGVIAVSAGVICLVMHMSILGIILICAGLLVIFHKNNMCILSDTESQELNKLQNGLDIFILRYYNSKEDIDSKLADLMLDIKVYTELNEKKHNIENEISKIDTVLNEKDQYLKSEFSKYFTGEVYRDTFVKELTSSYNKYKILKEESEKTVEKCELLHKEIDDYTEQLIGFLDIYYKDIDSSDLRKEIHRLRDDIKDYNRLVTKKQSVEGNENVNELEKILSLYNSLDKNISYYMCLHNLTDRFNIYKTALERYNRYKKELDNATFRKEQANQRFKQFLDKYELVATIPENLLDYIDNDIHNIEYKKQELADAKKKLDAFISENPDVESNDSLYDSAYYDIDKLKAQIKEKQSHVDTLDDELRKHKLERDKLRSSIETLPELKDRIESLKDKKQEAERKCSIVDKTISLLEQAKDRITNGYTYKIESAFRSYYSKLMDNNLGNILVDSDLRLHIVRNGDEHEVDNFSTGTVDCITICMRLALVNALFGNEIPFLILDDPFINMDDERTKCALEMIQKIAQDHQVIYLVCNSSRK